MQAESVPKVSVCVVTYNQEKYIAQCLQSLVDQVTNFTFEILVADDCSTDGTREIIKEFSDKYPRIFKLFLHKRNIGAYENFRFIHEQASAEYIAHMDGDDYALPGKLQAQASLLDNDPTCNLVWTPVFIETEPGKLHEQSDFFYKNIIGKKYSRSHLIRYGTIGCNSSKMYRKFNIDAEIPLPDFELIDYFVNVLQVREGVARFAGDRPLGVYRMGRGISSAGSKTKILTLNSIKYFSTQFPEYLIDCNIAAAMHTLVDAKNKRVTFRNSFRVFIETFHWATIFALIRDLRFMKNLSYRRK